MDGLSECKQGEKEVITEEGEGREWIITMYGEGREGEREMD